MVAVPSPLLVKRTPAGNAPLSVIVGWTRRNPLVVMVNPPGAAATNVVLFALVICGAGAWAKAVETIAANTRHDISHDTAFR
jgi:hypothetical protein